MIDLFNCLNKKEILTDGMEFMIRKQEKLLLLLIKRMLKKLVLLNLIY